MKKTKGIQILLIILVVVCGIFYLLKLENVNIGKLNRTFTKEDALNTSLKEGLWITRDEGSSGYSVVTNIKLENAVYTGSGQAWIMEGTDYHASTSICPKKENDPVGGGWAQTVDIRFEMNKASGKTDIKKTCHWSVFD